MIQLIQMFFLPVIIGVVLLSYLEGKLHLSVPRLLNVGKTIALGILTPLFGILNKLIKGTAGSIIVKKGPGNFKTREHHPPRW